MDEEQPKRVVGRPFQVGNPGRPKGSRNKLGEAFIETLYADFTKHGDSVIERVREEDPAAYMRVCASILPKELEIKRPLSDLTDDELIRAIELLRLAALGAPGSVRDGSEDEAVRKPH